jgi:hypothetical protein
VPVCKGIDMAMKYNALSDLFRILKIITALHIVAYVISNDDLVGIT